MTRKRNVVAPISTIVLLLQMTCNMSMSECSHFRYTYVEERVRKGVPTFQPTVSISSVQNIQLAPFERSGRSVDSLGSPWLNPFDVSYMLDVIDRSIAAIVTPVTASDDNGQSNDASNYAGEPHVDSLSFSI